MILALVVLGFALAGCGDDAATPDQPAPEGDGSVAGDGGPDAAMPEPEDDGVHMRLAPLSEGFYAQPWPLASRLRDDGTLDMTGFLMPAAASFVAENLETLARNTHGFATTGAIYATFDGAIDPDSLPTPEQWRDLAASVALIEVGADSGERRGERHPISCSVSARASGYTPPNLLACAPVPGFPLRPETTYALVFTDALLDERGEPVRRSRRMDAVLEGRTDGDPLAAELAEAYAPLVDLVESGGFSLDGVVGGTVFTTQDPLAEMRALADDVHAQETPAPNEVTAYTGMLPAESGNYAALTGTYATPIYQQGLTPYTLFGGDIQFRDGEPVQAGAFPVRFGLTVPNGEMPEGGWPVVLYHHGTGGDAYSFITDGTAFHLAAAGVAGISIDAPVHGTRSGGLDPQFSFFNILNVLALRDNIRQGAVDLLVLERFVEGFELAAAQSPTGSAVRFDRERVFAMGHSQGSLLLPVMLPFSECVKGVMLSGAGASITASILYKHAPVDIPALARMYLALGEGETLDAFHPALTLLQAFSEVGDSSNYAPYAYRWPGGRGLDVWVTQGLLDTFAPPEVTNALVTAYGLSPLAPLAERVPGLTLAGLSEVTAPVSANRAAIDGERYTAVYAQYPNSDHFLIMQNPTAEMQLERWFRSLAEQGRAELYRP